MNNYQYIYCYKGVDVVVMTTRNRHTTDSGRSRTIAVQFSTANYSCIAHYCNWHATVYQ